MIVPNRYVQGLEVSENHLLVETKEETTASLEEKIRKDMEDQLVKEGEDAESRNVESIVLLGKPIVD